MKKSEWKLISELMKNSRRSDRELAKTIGVSQPTVSRMIKKLEKEGYIEEYIMIPDFSKLGYKILAITFFKYKQSFDAEKVKKAREILNESFKKGPFEIIMAERGMGLGYNALMISIHKDYTSLVELKNWAKQFTSLGLVEIESFLINLADKIHYRSLTFATLAKHVLMQEEVE